MPSPTEHKKDHLLITSNAAPCSFVSPSQTRSCSCTPRSNHPCTRQAPQSRRACFCSAFPRLLRSQRRATTANNPSTFRCATNSGPTHGQTRILPRVCPGLVESLSIPHQVTLPRSRRLARRVHKEAVHTPQMYPAPRHRSWPKPNPTPPERSPVPALLHPKNSGAKSPAAWEFRRCAGLRHPFHSSIIWRKSRNR